MLKKEILEIYNIFSKIVDCKGNLKIFKNLTWNEKDQRYKMSKADEDRVVVCVKKDDNKEKYLNESNKDDSYYKNKIEYYYQANDIKKMLDLCYDNQIKDFKQCIPNTTTTIFSNNKNSDYLDIQISILLYKFNSLLKGDFKILYNSFYDILAKANFNFCNNYSILYLTIFQKILEYFSGKEIDFLYTEQNNGSVNAFSISNDIKNKLKNFQIIHQIICKILDYIYMKLNLKSNAVSIDNKFLDALLKNCLGNALKDILEKELYQDYNNLKEIYENFEDELLKAIYKLLNRNTISHPEKCSKNIIYYGAPGTGKTYFVKSILNLLNNLNFPYEAMFIQFHPSYDYEDFIDGIKPVGIDNNGNLKLDFINGDFKEFCMKASKDSDKPYFFIIDEINRADVSSVFGETLTLLEYRGASNAIKTKNSRLIENLITQGHASSNLSILYQNGESKFYIPENVYIIGTMNDVDKSIDCFDLALRRRFTWILKECDYGLLIFCKNATPDYIDKCKELNEFITSSSGLNLGRAYEIGHSYFMKIENLSVEEIWQRHIEPILREYIRSVYADEDIEEQIEKAKKIFVG